MESSNVELDMISRLRDERAVAFARALAYARWGDTLLAGMQTIVDCSEVSDFVKDYAKKTIKKAEQAFKEESSGN